MINLTDRAKDKLIDILSYEKNPEVYLRVYIQGGGCSGMEYGFSFSEDKNEDDFQFDFDRIKVLVDSVSFQYIDGAMIDYQEDMMMSKFVVTNNPNAATSCGCGSSFSPSWEQF
jgi:iron-sulfur cluster insertion protein